MKRFSNTVSTVNLVLFILNLVLAGFIMLGGATAKDVGGIYIIVGLVFVFYSLLQYFVGRCIVWHFKYKELDLEIKGFRNWKQN